MARARRSRRRQPAFVPAWKPKQRPLLRLSDQGAPVPIDPGLFGIGGRDRGWNAHAENFISANRPQLTALDIQPEFAAQAREIALRLRPGGVVGAVPLRTPDTRKVAGGVVVRPRFGWEGIGPLLQQIGWVASPRVLELPLVPGSAREVPPWVLAGPVLQRLASLLREIRKGFRMHEDVRQVPRGQILWQRYVAEQASRGAFHQMPCRFPELGPDALLRSYLRWGLERVHRSLVPYAVVDSIARRLSEQAEGLLVGLRDASARAPDRRTLDQLLRGAGLPSAVLQQGLQALAWIVDERGLAGAAETDGLAWALPMHELFERWVEHVVRLWGREFGGQVLAGRAHETVVPIDWDRRAHGSMKSLVPDLVVRHQDRVYVIDAKYKGHFQEFDDARWLALSEELRDEHRCDLHQVLAYASLYEAAEMTAVLVYPMRERTWTRLAERGRTVVQARLSGGGRLLRLALAALPLRTPEAGSISTVVRSLDRLRATDPHGAAA